MSVMCVSEALFSGKSNGTSMDTNSASAIQFSNTFLYIDDLFSVNNEEFGNDINTIYPSELELKDTSTSQRMCVTSAQGSSLNTYRNASENSKAEIPGAAYLSKIESFIEDHYVRGELFFEFCRDACNKQSDASSTLCSWCTNNRWVGPVTERIPQPVPVKQNPGHFMDVYETPTTGRAPDDYQPKKCLKDLYEQNAISAGNPNTIAAFCATYSVEEKHVIEYLGHLNDINIRKDIRTREAIKEKKRLEEELTYKDYQWGILIENGKVEKLKVRQLDLYLKEHGLTTVGIKLDKIKAIRYHYYRQRSPGNGNELSSSEEESEESDTELDDDEDSEDDLVIADLDEQSTVRMPVLTFVPDDQVAEVTVQANTG
ncbi:uncharacterized protein [Porites lutea]|uniref:uncharacterized protein n=1 Tax=Porites lutea TaxID=51062 RepID=UPI003CC54B67